MAPVAHVPIGAAHYAHLPPSVWGPAHAQYHHAPPHAHQGPVQAVNRALHVQMHPAHHHASSHLHHLATQPTAPHMYSHSVSQSAIAQHAVHGHTIHSPHQFSYQYTHVQQAPPLPPPQSVKEQVALMGSHPGAAPGAYSTMFPQVSTVARGVKASVKQENRVSPSDGASVKRIAECVGTTASDDDKCRSGGTRQLSSPLHQNSGTAVGGVSLRKAQTGRVSSRGADGVGSGPEQEKGSSGSQLQRAQQSPGQPMRKPRKPYTITKSREVWAPEEHDRFLHALQLYDRDWKKIEVYIGTKTVLQIRSHAQKHFGKVTKYKTGEYIPPPRPKKRSALPYPRNRFSAGSKSGNGSGSSGSDSCAATEIGIASGNGSGSGSNTNGNHSETLLDLCGGPAPLDDRGVHGKSGHSPRRNQQQRTRPAAMHEGDNNAMSGSQHPYYNSSSGHTYQRQELPRMQGLSPNSRSDSQRMQEHPPLDGLKVDARENVRNDMENVFHAKPSGDAKGPVSHTGNDVRDNPGRDKCGIHPNGMLADLEVQKSGVGKATKSDEKTSQSPEGSERRSLSVKEGIRENKSLHGEDAGRVSGPNNSLLVLSNCVDMMARDAPPERPPAAGWATAAAARRAHRAKIIRSRKPPLPGPPTHSQAESLITGTQQGIPAGSNGPGCQEARSSAGPLASETPVEESVRDSSASPLPCPNVPEERGRSPPTVPSDEVNRCSQDPQRSSAGSGSNSDDAIAGFSSSDRPSLSDMGGSPGGSGSGGSLENSDTGEEDPKSSNDGSGDDANRQSSSNRDSSPADPASSGSRENSPNAASTDNDGNEATEPPTQELRAHTAGSESRTPLNPETQCRVLIAKEGVSASAITPAAAKEDSDKSSWQHRCKPMGDQIVCNVHDIVGKGSEVKPVLPQSTDRIGRSPQTIANLCNAIPPSCGGVPRQITDDNKKRARCAVSGGSVKETGATCGERDMVGEPAKRRRHSENGTVEALLNDPSEHQIQVPNSTLTPGHS